MGRQANCLPTAEPIGGLLNTAAFLREKGIQPSPQRLRIYEALASTREHPSADAIHRQLSPEMPTLSRTTVYSTLELFVGAGIAQELAITGSELRFDAEVSSHAHFACRSCGRVVDLGLLEAAPLPELPRGYLAESSQYFMTGTCPTCTVSKDP
ncbi:MAG: Fur family transcriptional regulator [Spirochaetota bacterium]